MKSCIRNGISEGVMNGVERGNQLIEREEEEREINGEEGSFDRLQLPRNKGGA